MRRTFLSLAIILSAAGNAFAYGGSKAYQFLTLPTSTTVSALGGDNVSLYSGEVTLAQQNPALLSAIPGTSVGLSYFNYIADANYGSLTFGQAVDSLSWWGVGFTFMGYGTFDAYDEYGVEDGTFSASDMDLSLMYVRRLASNFSMGMALKPVYSHIADYSSFGLALDLGAFYYLPEKLFSAGLAVHNFGVQFTPYEDERESLPWDVQVGVTKKLAHAPFRFNLTYTKLNKWNFDYEKDANLYKASSSYVEAEYKEDVSWGDMFMRHMVIGVEFVPTKNFSVAASYNHRRHKEFAMENAGGAAGWSFGANLHVYKFALGASYAIYGPSGGVFGVNLSSCIDDFRKKDK